MNKPIKRVVTVLTEENLKDILFKGEAKSNGITFLLNGEPGYKKVNFSDYHLYELIDRKTTKSYGLYDLIVEFTIEDIKYEKIYEIVTKYNEKTC